MTPSTQLCIYLLALVRVAAFVGMMPGFGRRYIPRLVKLSLVCGLTMVMAPVASDPIPEISSTWIRLAMLTGREALLGALLGFAFGIVMEPIRAAGAYLEDQIGFTLGATLSGEPDQASTTVGQVLDAFGLLLFFSMDIHHRLFLALRRSFEVVGLGDGIPDGMLAATLGHAAEVPHIALRLAFPVGTLLFLVSVLSVIVMRAAPQVHFLSVSFTLRIMLGLFGLVILFPEMVALMLRLFQQVDRIAADV